MARIEIDPNYSSPTFSRATAGTDLFKKEDVQALASAMSTHDHSSGHGLAVARLAAGAIPDGSITSAMIADGTITSADILDGTIQTADIGARQVTAVQIAVATTSNPATTSAVPVLSPEMTITWTGVASEQWVALYFCSAFVTGAGAVGTQNINFNGGDGPVLAYQRPEQVQGSIMIQSAGNSAIGSNTVKAQCWVTGGGTLTLMFTYRTLILVRFLR